MTQAMHCQRCGDFIDTVLTDKKIINYHYECWIEWQQSQYAAARGKPWHKLGETTEYQED